MASLETANELGDWEWQKFKDEFDIINWDTKLNGLQRVGVALIGLGRMGLVHMRNLLREPRAKLKYCIDVDEIRLDTCNRSVFFKDRAIRALHSDQLGMALEDPEVQAVVIAAPSIFHYELVKKSLEAGKNVMCEKPLSTNSDDITSLYKLAKSKSVFLLTAFNRHYDNDFRSMRQDTVNGSIGSIQLIRTVARDGQLPSIAYLKESGGIFHDSCIHDFDQMIWIKRQLPVSVQAVGITWQEYFKNQPSMSKQLSDGEQRMLGDIDDYFMAVMTLQFPDGSIGVIDKSRYSNYGCDERCEIFGATGTLKCDGRNSSRVLEFGPGGIVNPGINYAASSRYGAAYQLELQDFLTMTNLSINGESDDIDQVRAHVLEYPKGTLVMAAAKVADTCFEAVKTGDSVKIKWNEEFRRQFENEIHL